MADGTNTNPPAVTFQRGLVPTKLGLIHYTAVGDAESTTLLPIVGFHMSPRSVDEYKEIMTLCDDQRLFLAMDEFGYGNSDSPAQSCTLDEIADCFYHVLVKEFPQIQQWIVSGSLMGCYMALSLASRYPRKFAGVVCSNLYYYLEEAREKAIAAQARVMSTPTGTPIPDPRKISADGSHLTDIWNARSSWLTPALNTRVTLDNLVYLVKRKDRFARGIHIQDGGAFPLPETCANVSCPVLCLNGAAAVSFFDAIGMDMTGQFQEAVGFFDASKTDVKTVLLQAPGVSINMLNENADLWLEHVTAFCNTIRDDTTSI